MRVRRAPRPRGQGALDYCTTTPTDCTITTRLLDCYTTRSAPRPKTRSTLSCRSIGCFTTARLLSYYYFLNYTTSHTRTDPFRASPHNIVAFVLQVRWDPSTGDAGDPYAAAQERERQAAAELDAALRNSQRRGTPVGRVGLMSKYDTHLAQQRAAKAERRKLDAAGMNISWTRTAAPPPLVPADALEMSRRVPAKKVTSWSLGGF